MTVISLSEVRDKFIRSSCAHRRIFVDEKLAFVECQDCGEKINPVAILVRMSREESRWAQEGKRLCEVREVLEKRMRCKCDHCGQMTRIHV